jgi:hypothetical protein
MRIHPKKRLCMKVNVSSTPITILLTILVAEQWLLLHPSDPNFSLSNSFKPIDDEAYSTFFLSDKLISKNFCRFHDSPLFNHIQVDLWGRINQSVDHLLKFKNLFHVDDFLRHYAPLCLEKTSLAMKTGWIDVDGDRSVDDGHIHISCIGTLPPDFRCIYLCFRLPYHLGMF